MVGIKKTETSLNNMGILSIRVEMKYISLKFTFDFISNARYV